MQSSTSVSVIIPVYNNETTIISTIDSVVNQINSDWEILIIDDGSTDHTLILLEKHYQFYQNINFSIRDRSPKGASTCRNIGIDQAKGEYLIFLDADDQLSPNCLADRLKAMQENPELDFGIFNMDIFNNAPYDTQQRINIYTNNTQEYIKLFLTYQIPWQTTCPIWKSSFIKNNQIYFSETYQRLQDVEFHSRILLNYNPKFHVFKESEVDCFYRQPQSKSKPVNEASLLKTTQSILLYYTEMHQLITNQEHDKCLDSFVVNIFHSLLFYTKLTTTNPIIDLYRQMNEIRQINNISLNSIRLFAMFNKLRLTFVKGVGISRIWKGIMTK